MKLSTRTRYGVRLMIYVALHEQDGPVLLRQVAEHEDISEKYLSQIVIPLKARGLIGASRGSNGGYFLTRAAQEISLREIVETFETQIRMVDCEHDTNGKFCLRASECVMYGIWQGLSVTIGEYLSRFTLADLVCENMAVMKETGGVYGAE